MYKYRTTNRIACVCKLRSYRIGCVCVCVRAAADNASCLTVKPLNPIIQLPLIAFVLFAESVNSKLVCQTTSSSLRRHSHTNRRHQAYPEATLRQFHQFVATAACLPVEVRCGCVELESVRTAVAAVAVVVAVRPSAAVVAVLVAVRSRAERRAATVHMLNYRLVSTHFLKQP